MKTSEKCKKKHACKEGRSENERDMREEEEEWLKTSKRMGQREMESKEVCVGGMEEANIKWK